MPQGAQQFPGAGGCRSSFSFLLIAVSLYLRLRVAESPVFKRMKENRSV